MAITNSKPIPGDKLILVGFGNGRASTTKYDVYVSNDDDCVYLSGNKNVKIGKDITKNTFFIGCDTVQGDSGSAVINRVTGELIGLYFGMANPDMKNPLTSEEIYQNLGTDFLEFETNSSWAIDIRTIPLN
ncbi:MAG: hypothetical protein BM556_12015 [Bacteriovorax sp. MedPE-SWde]|nr:MAG: hypothetical protein BM556_12015 [Bacteriovorax sp. MedPE-SWde]